VGENFRCLSIPGCRTGEEDYGCPENMSTEGTVKALIKERLDNAKKGWPYQNKTGWEKENGARGKRLGRSQTLRGGG